ncbi:hypothetical protein BJ170DRAFT_685046 [Xylariales sp. AK1849]|nr:hypothetical protein BJ170DRAFT_685046 [Xylariales sp. AK1849]
MSTVEEQELLAQINRLEGRINRHKAGQSHPPHQYTRGSYRATPYQPPRAGFRGTRSHAPTYRNKTLVLNGQSRPSATSGDPTANTNESDSQSWVSRTDRHLQLINSTVFEKDSQTRASAIEQTQRQKRLQKERTEKSRILNFVHKNMSSNPTSAASKYEITVDDIRFQVTKQGSKLVRAPGENNPPIATPRVALVGGVKFYRTKNGNLVRHGIAKAQRMASEIKKVDAPCKAFSWTGSCHKGPRCRFMHNPSKVAVCRDWLFKNDCPNGDACDLAHETTEERTPLCLHFANGKCNNDSCPYTHAEHSQADPVCRAFGLYGYCDKGARCPDRHVFECPDFSNTGICKTEGCKLLHRERASVLRKAGNDEEMGDLSSEEEEDAGAGDDIDSDEVEEFIGNDDNDDNDDLDFSRDFIGF